MTASAAALLLASLFSVTGVLAQDAEPAIMDAGQLDPATIAKFYKKPGYSPYAGRNYPTRVFWGDSTSIPAIARCRSVREHADA